MRFSSRPLEALKINLLRALGTFRSWVIGRHGIAVLSRSENGLLLAPAGDLMVGRRLSFYGCYDSDLLRLIYERCESTSHVLFVGAHVGALAIPVARKVRRVLAIEANPATFELLRMNVALGDVSNIQLFNFAAGDRNEDVPFLANTLNSGGSGVAIGEWNDWAYRYDKPTKVMVPMKRLDDVFPDDNFDLIVMDIEGAEGLALRGMQNMLKRSRGLLIEVFEDHLRQVAKISNEEFLSLVAQFYDQAQILPEKARKRQFHRSPPYPRSAFSQMMADCCKQRMANVLFWKTCISVEKHSGVGAKESGDDCSVLATTDNCFESEIHNV